MSNSPVKFAGVAARAVSGGGGSRGNNAIDAVMGGAMQRFLGGIVKTRRSQAELAQARIDSKKYKSLTYRDRMRALGRSKSIASQASSQITAPASVVENNNSIENTVAAAEDRSQMRDAGELTSVNGPAGFSTMSSAVLDPISRQPMGGVQPVPSIQEQATPEDVATYGVAGAAESMFGTPMQRQMSMGSSLMKRACKYKNK